MFFRTVLTKKRRARTKNEPYNKSQIYDSLENLFYANNFFVRTAENRNEPCNEFYGVYSICTIQIGVVVLKLTQHRYHIQNPFASTIIKDKASIYSIQQQHVVHIIALSVYLSLYICTQIFFADKFSAVYGEFDLYPRF